MSCVQVAMTTPTPELARSIAERLVAERLAACVQVGGKIESRYRWRGEVETAQEWTCVAKTTQRKLAALVEAVRAMHGYELPEIVATPIVGGSDAYLAWIEEATL